MTIKDKNPSVFESLSKTSTFLPSFTWGIHSMDWAHLFFESPMPNRNAQHVKEEWCCFLRVQFVCPYYGRPFFMSRHMIFNQVNRHRCHFHHHVQLPSAYHDWLLVKKVQSVEKGNGQRMKVSQRLMMHFHQENDITHKLRIWKGRMLQFGWSLTSFNRIHGIISLIRLWRCVGSRLLSSCFQLSSQLMAALILSFLGCGTWRKKRQFLI